MKFKNFIERKKKNVNLTNFEHKELRLEQSLTIGK